MADSKASAPEKALLVYPRNASDLELIDRGAQIAKKLGLTLHIAVMYPRADAQQPMPRSTETLLAAALGLGAEITLLYTDDATKSLATLAERHKADTLLLHSDCAQPELLATLAQRMPTLSLLLYEDCAPSLGTPEKSEYREAIR